MESVCSAHRQAPGGTVAEPDVRSPGPGACLIPLPFVRHGFCGGDVCRKPGKEPAREGLSVRAPAGAAGALPSPFLNRLFLRKGKELLVRLDALRHEAAVSEQCIGRYGSRYALRGFPVGDVNEL